MKKKDIKAFQNTWAKFNPMGELYMRTLKLSDFLRDLPPPLGYQGTHPWHRINSFQRPQNPNNSKRANIRARK